MNIKKLFIILGWGSMVLSIQAQERWDLQMCIEYGLTHNRSLKKQLLNIRSNQTQLTEAYMAFLPSLSGNTGLGYSFGRSVDPETNTYFTTSNLNNNYSVGISIPVFKGGALVHQLKIRKVQQEMGKTYLEVLKDETALHIIEAYIAVVYYHEMIVYARQRLEESKVQVKKIRLQKELGMKGKAEVALIEAQYAQDDYTLTHTENQKESALLKLKQLMNFPAENPLHITLSSEIANEPIHSPALDVPHEIAQTYTLALENNPNIQRNRLSLRSQLYSRRQALSNFFPNISFSAGASSSFYRSLNKGAYKKFSQQLKDNRGSYLSFNVSIPLFNRLGNIMNYRRQKIQYHIAQEDYEAGQEALRTSVQQAILDRESLRKEYLRMQRKVEADSIAYHIVARKFDEGLCPPIDLQSAANTLLSSRASCLQCRLNFFIKSKLTAYYQGQELY